MTPSKIVDVTPKSNGQTFLYVATPCYGCMMSTAFLIGLLQLKTECLKRGIAVTVDFMGNESLVQRARNIFAARFLKRTAATHLLFIDADIGFKPEAVFRLLEADKDIATAVYPKKSYNWGAVQAKLRDTKTTEPPFMAGLDYNINIDPKSATLENGFVRVLDAATGFMLIKRQVLETMRDRYAPTLSCVNDLPGNRDDPAFVSEYVAMFDCMIDPTSKRALSEDFSAVRRAQECGFEVWADVTTPLCHIGTYMFEGDIRQRFTMVYSG